MKTYAIYSRKSKFTQKGESTENQIALCKSYIEKTFQEEAPFQYLIYEDEGFSGKSLERPQFKKMLSEAKEQKFSAIIVYRLDRISRNICDFSYITETLNFLGIDFISIKENFDTSSPTGRAMMYISSIFSQLERETTAERVRDNMKELSKTGRWLGGITPFGFYSKEITYESHLGKPKKMYCLEKNENESEIIKIIFSKFLETASLAQTQNYLLEKGLKTRNNKNFSKFTIKNILSNPVYMTADMDAFKKLQGNGFNIYSDKSKFDGMHGIIPYNRTIQTTGKCIKKADRKDWIIAVGKHKGIINGNTWFYVQSILENLKPQKISQKTQSLLSGILFCETCKSKMRPKKTSEKNFSYVCTQKEKSRKSLCSAENINGNSLDEAVVSKICEIKENTSILIKGFWEYRKSLLAIDASDSLSFSANHFISETENRIQNLCTSLSLCTSSSSKKLILSQIENLLEEKKALEKILKDTSAKTNKISAKEFSKSLLSFEFILDTLSLSQKRNLIRCFTQSIYAQKNFSRIILSPCPPSISEE